MNDLFKLGGLQELLYVELDSLVKEGIKLDFVHEFIFDFMVKNQLEVIPYSYPVSINVNNKVYHGCDKEIVLKKNDIVTIDTCFKLNSALIDGAKSFSVDSNKHDEILDVSKKVIIRSLEEIKEGFKVAELIKFVDEYVSLKGFYLFPHGLGHGISNVIHDRPFISMSYYDDYGYKFKRGDIFTLEPLIFLKKEKVVENEQGEGFVSKGNLSSQFEVTILIGDDGMPLVINSGLIK